MVFDAKINISRNLVLILKVSLRDRVKKFWKFKIAVVDNTILFENIRIFEISCAISAFPDCSTLGLHILPSIFRLELQNP